MTDNVFGTNTTQGSLRSRGITPPIVAYFQFNPQSINDRRRVNYADVDAPGQILPFHQYVKGGERSLSFNVEIAGALAANRNQLDLGEDGDISHELRKYRSLLYPKNPAWQSAELSQAATFAAVRQFQTPPICLLCLGTRTLDCILSDLSIEETMFNPQLLPVAASLNLTVKEIVPYGGADLTLGTGQRDGAAGAANL